MSLVSRAKVIYVFTTKAQHMMRKHKLFLSLEH